QLGNSLLGNPQTAAGLEMTLNGPTLRFNRATQIVISGADMQPRLELADGTLQAIKLWQVVSVPAGGILRLGKVSGAGARTYLLVKGGIDCPDYLGSKSTFTLGQFGGHGGRALGRGEVLHLGAASCDSSTARLPHDLLPTQIGR